MNIDWSSLGFHYTEPEYIVRAGYHNGKWEEPYATTDKYLHLHVSATCLQYGQEAFEGLKAFRGIDGKIRIFRWKENAKRMAKSAEGLFMAPVPEELFGKAIHLALEKNLELVPPYGTGATLYFRPLLIGTTPRLGVGPGKDFEFIVIPSPIGPYYPGKFHCTTFIVNRYVDRAAPYGTGQFKVGGNYASSFRATEAAHMMGCDCLFLDAKQHKFIDECSAANFIGIKDNEYLTPKSSAILPSITNDSLMTLAKEMGLKVTRRRIRLEELADMSEAAACGTACVISPIDKVVDTEKGVTYSFGDEPGPVLSKLYHALKDIQYGRAEDKHGWCEII
ncbi:MAG: branched-chain amino acid aminotransferase [Paludibacteraceae bacterium]|nr:branched-chain amino acid aminotransferase [Paludibacteraceae bacterium]